MEEGVMETDQEEESGGGGSGRGKHGKQRAQARVGHGVCGQMLGLPHHPHDLARAQRGHHHRAGLNPHPLGNAIIQRPQRRVQHQKAHAADGGGVGGWGTHRCGMGRFCAKGKMRREGSCAEGFVACAKRL